MNEGYIAILDIGKTMAKLSFWSDEAKLMARYTRPNQKCVSDAGYACLDVAGIEAWIKKTLQTAPLTPHIRKIVPVAHGAGACFVKDGKLLAVPSDYEAAPPAEISKEYEALRAPFNITGTPALPDGLNLGRQIYWMHQINKDVADGTIIPWAQYFSWRFSGVAATEVSSLGCHTDLWAPFAGKPSPLAEKQGWAKRFGVLHKASDVLGKVSKEWVESCGLSPDCEVVCGLHDSNAALLAIRGYKDLEGRPCTVVSTGTWFIGMHSVPAQHKLDVSKLSEARDCLVNVDVHGVAVPSARFMGGRECDLIEAFDGERVDILTQSEDIYRAAEQVVANGIMAIPTFAHHVGPYQNSKGRWVKRPEDQLTRRAAAGLYLALMANTSLSLVGSSDAIVIEGRFADDPVFTRVLAQLRPGQTIYKTNAHDCVPFGALRLVNPELEPQAPLVKIVPADFDVSAYAATWQEKAGMTVSEMAA